MQNNRHHMLLQHHAVTHTIAHRDHKLLFVGIAPRVHMHGSNYMAQGQMQPCIAQRTPTRRPDCLPGSAGGQGILSCSATKTPALPWHAQHAVPWEAAAGTSRNAIAAPLCMVLPRLGGGSATSRWPWRSDPRVSTAKARIRPLASRDTARRRADPAPNRRRQARLPDASNWRQTG